MPDKQTIENYRRTFSSPHGQETLADLLDKLCVFSPLPATAEVMALKDFGMWLLAVLGGGHISQENMKTFTMRLMKQPLIIQEEKEDY
ncbi:MAG: hypothetical protein ABIJ57_00395 [Pseudomonadota bacterium]